MRQLAEKVAGRAGLFRPARNVYQRIAKPEVRERRHHWQQFFSQFLEAGDLVFDIGANRGDLTGEFLDMDCRVVAVEPIAELAETIRRRYACRSLTVEQAAVAASPGKAVMHVAEWKHLSTLSQARAEARPELWADLRTVRVLTLDDLVAEHGPPQFVKIDVEGGEEEVLTGLTAPVHALSFEFGIMPAESLNGCIALLKEFEFNFSVGNEYKLRSAEWLGADAVEAAVANLAASRTGTGDIYARRR